MVFERLHPTPGSGPAEAWVAQARSGARARPDRPYVWVNMVATVDGRATVGGRSGSIGSAADTRMMAELRTLADAVLIGTGTLRAERYGRLVRDPARRERRVAAGLAADPLAVLVSRSLDLPWSSALFTEPAQRVAIACPAAADAAAVPAGLGERVSLLRVAEPFGAGAALRALRAEHGVRTVLCEGGPTLNGRLLADGALDELFLTLGPLLAGEGAAPGIVGGEGLVEPAQLELRWLLRCGDELFLRYAVARG